MNNDERVLIFDPNYSMFFSSNFTQGSIQWTGDDIGDVTNILNKVPALKGKNMFCIQPSNQHILLEKYTTHTHIIETIKRIYQMDMIPYNICTYKKKKYIMYQYIPFNEYEYNPTKKKQFSINEIEKKLIAFHWILGVKGKIVLARSSNGDVIMSKSKYSNVNYLANDIKPNILRKVFGDYNNFISYVNLFFDSNKLALISEVFSHETYKWFYEIKERITKDRLTFR